MQFKLRSIICNTIFSLLVTNNVFASPEEVLHQYFAAVKSHDIQRILNVFEPDAVIVTAKGKIQGSKSIREFYQKGVLKCAQFQPEPGPFLIAKKEIAVEIKLHCDGIEKKVGDFFTIRNNKIVSMRVYSGQGYNP